MRTAVNEVLEERLVQVRHTADGQKFEREMFNLLCPIYYIKRLPTLNTGFSGVRQKADFYVVGSRFTYLELKETTAKSFYVAKMQQLDKVVEFIEERDRLMALGTVQELEYYLVVKFMRQQVLKVLTANEIIALKEMQKGLTAETVLGKTFNSMQQLKEELIF